MPLLILMKCDKPTYSVPTVLPQKSVEWRIRCFELRCDTEDEIIEGEACEAEGEAKRGCRNWLP